MKLTARELWLRQQREAKAALPAETKVHETKLPDETKLLSETKVRKIGRPRLGTEPMTSTERVRRYRARDR
jgi:hypothetical protein